MAVVAKFFQMSMSVRDAHSYLVEKKGIPTWGSYLIFGLATLVLGCILGFVSGEQQLTLAVSSKSFNQFSTKCAQCFLICISSCLTLIRFILQFIVCIIDYLFPAGTEPVQKSTSGKQQESKKDMKGKKQQKQKDSKEKETKKVSLSCGSLYLICGLDWTASCC